jgi:hypothetical protein
MSYKQTCDTNELLQKLKRKEIVIEEMILDSIYRNKYKN